MSPLDVYDAPYIIGENSIGGNVGNLIYAYSVYRTLMTENTEIVPDYYSRNPNNADKINETYDCYVIPLADAFRDSFVKALRDYTKLIKRLKIPVIVIGVGLRASFEPKLDEGFEFDEDVKAFVQAVLEKSNIIGVRGQITADYLTKLGFKEGVDHMVIGCPSMYAFGRDLNIRKTNITKDSVVAVNSSKLSPKNVLSFIQRSMEEYPNHYFIPQWMKELVLTYTGFSSLGNSESYPVKRTDNVYKNNRVRYFLNAPTWIDFMSKVDLSVGARLHGNVTATIAGTPSLIIPKDARMRELAEYHKLTSIWWNDINEDTRLEEVIEQSDFSSPETVQAGNFDNYITFLDRNNLSHIFTTQNSIEESPLDKKVKELNLHKPVCSITSCTTEEAITRWENYNEMREEQANKKISKLNKKLKNANEKLKSK